MVFFIMLLAFSVANIKPFLESITISSFLSKTAWFFVCYFSVLLLNFMVSKNSLTKRNHYHILLFGLFFLLLPETTMHGNILVSNSFVLLGLRRLLSLRTQIMIKKKLFDTAVYFALASLFYFWTILFVILIFATLLLYTDNRVKNWMVPFAGLATVFIMATSTSVILYGDFFQIFNRYVAPNYNYSMYNTPQHLIAITMLFSFGIWASIFYVKLVQKKKKAFKPSFKIILTALIIAMGSVILSPQKNGGEFLFLFAPLSIVMTNYIESIKEKWFKELYVVLIIIIPFVLLML